jgi:MazG family protein
MFAASRLGFDAASHGVASAMTKRHGIVDLLAVMARLRDPESGCPWDREQTFATIAPYTIEEAYEVADAIERGDMDALRDELGDLLLQVVYHAQMAAESDRFNFSDVVDAVTAKMIRRHPHVFSDPSRRDEFLRDNLWERIKAEEKAERNGAVPASVLDDVPPALPSLTRAVKLQKRAARVGFDWPELTPVIDKAEEELGELKAALADSAAGTSDATQVAEEFGDLLFVMANIARHLDVDPETALRSANAKFVRRFHSIEDALSREGRKPEDATLEEMDRLWDAAKDAERKV